MHAHKSKWKTTDKWKFHTGCHIVIPDSEAHHQEIEVQTQNCEKNWMHMHLHYNIVKQLESK